MERRAASHTEEEEMNQRRRLLNLARKGDPKAVSRLFELYQVKIYTGDMLTKANRTTQFSPLNQQKPSQRKKEVKQVGHPTPAAPRRKTRTVKVTRKATPAKRRRR